GGRGGGAGWDGGGERGDRGTAQSRRSETRGATQGPRQSASRSRQSGRSLCGAQGRSDRGCKVGDDDIDAKSDELSRNLGGAIAASLGIADLECDIPAFGIAMVLQATP